MSSTYEQRLAFIAGHLDGLGEDTATDVGEGTFDVDAHNLIAQALDCIERAIAIVKGA
jgi:hypothetical protein